MIGQVIRIESDNTTMVAYINKEGEVCSEALNRETVFLYEWANLMNIELQAVHQPGMDNILADYQSRNVADPME